LVEKVYVAVAVFCCFSLNVHRGGIISPVAAAAVWVVPVVHALQHPVLFWSGFQLVAGIAVTADTNTNVAVGTTSTTTIAAAVAAVGLLALAQ